LRWFTRSAVSAAVPGAEQRLGFQVRHCPRHGNGIPAFTSRRDDAQRASVVSIDARPARDHGFRNPKETRL